MTNGRRFTPENPSPAMINFAEHIKSKGYDDSTDLQTIVAATFVFHKEWQSQHAEKVRQERAANAEKREEEKQRKAEEREAKKAERERLKAEKELEREEKRRQREEAKAEKEAKAKQEADAGGDSEDGGEDAPTPRKRLRLKKDAPQEAAAPSGSF